MHMLVAGKDCSSAAEAAGKIEGVTKVLCVEDGVYAGGLAENVAKLVVKLADGYSHVLAPATNYGKNIMPRAAALLDVMQISEITEVKDADTFVRPIYAGNALATVKSSDKIKIITVRATAFDAAPASGGSASVDRQGGGAGTVHRCRHLWRDPAFGRYEGLQSHRRDQQGRRSADLPGRGLWLDRRLVQSCAGVDSGNQKAPR